MKFGNVQQRRFGVINGAYSIVTDREYYDSQITLTDYEAELVISYFGRANIQEGNVGDNPELSSKPFRLYPAGQEVRLNVVFPKPDKSELRLYIASRAGFKPAGGDVWFILHRNNDLWIGTMPEALWRTESSELKKDDADSVYQESLDETDAIRIARLRERDTYARDRNVALGRIQQSGYTCEFDPMHKLFISRFSCRPYLEAHHLIPIGLQGDFMRPLDTISNVYCLCPYCHRAVHHAEKSIAQDILTTLVSKRNILDDFSLTMEELFSLYAIEEII